MIRKNRKVGRSFAGPHGTRTCSSDSVTRREVNGVAREGKRVNGLDEDEAPDRRLVDEGGGR